MLFARFVLVKNHCGETMPQKCARMLRALRSDLKAIVDFNGRFLDDFLSIYYSTLDRRDAITHIFSQNLFFSR